jgi:uncharacterized protein (DUF433 family)
VKLAVWNREVSWIDPATGKPAGVVSGQFILFELIDVIEDMKKETERLRKRTDDEYGKVIRNRNVAHNRPVFAGTRIPISAIQNFAKAGYSVEQILAEYPSLTEPDITAAVASLEPRTAA